MVPVQGSIEMAHPDEDVVREGFAPFGRGGLEALRRQYLAEDSRFRLHGRGPRGGDWQSAARVLGAGTLTGRRWLPRDLAAAISDVARDSNFVRVHVLTPAAVVDPRKQPGAGTPGHKHMSARLERLLAGCSA
jgi:hypothetical protein